MKTIPFLPAEPTCADLRAEIEVHLLALPEVDQMLTSIHRTLARHPERHASAQPLLTNLLEHRTQVAHRLGLAMASWVRAGGQLSLHSPDAPAASPADDATPAPAALPAGSLPLAEQPEDNSACLPASPPGAITQTTSSPIDEELPPRAPEPDVSSARDAPAPAPQTTPALTPQAKMLTELLALVGPPRYLNTVFEVLDEVEGLEALTHPPAMSRWPLR
ncbi:MAG: hypothetical protein EOO70_01585 [Myxococcaceae bacterium]|nr:MAG: hypothetical protein EOO70_01585 [Myxococcaceae bacterium]